MIARLPKSVGFYLIIWAGIYPLICFHCPLGIHWVNAFHFCNNGPNNQLLLVILILVLIVNFGIPNSPLTSVQAGIIDLMLIWNAHESGPILLGAHTHFGQDPAIRYNSPMQKTVQWIRPQSRWLRLGGLLLCALAIGWTALFLRERAVRRLPLDHDERTYLYAARYYARSIQKGDLGRMVDSDIAYEHPSLVKLVYGVALYLCNSDLPAFEKEGFIIGERLLDTNVAKPMLLTARNVSAWFGTFSVVVLALINPLAGFFLAVHSFAVKYTSEVYLESVPMLTSLLAVWSFQAWDDRSAKRNFRRDWLLLALSAVMLGLSAASKYIYIVVGIAITCYAMFGILSSILQNRRNRYQEHSTSSPLKQGGPVKRLIALAIWVILALLIFFAADIYLWHDPIHRLQSSLTFSMTFSQNEYVQSMNYPIWQPLFWLSRSVTQHDTWAVPHLPGDILVSIDTWIEMLAIIGLPRLIRKRPLFAWWLIIGVAFLLLWNTKWPQYVLIILAPLCLSAAEGIMTLLFGLCHLLFKLFSWGSARISGV